MKLSDRVRSRITEIAVIVVSILLAFALDAGWDEYREAREMRLVSEALTAEFAAAEEELNFSIARNQRVISASDSLLAGLRHGAGSVEVPSGTLGSLLLTPTTDPRSGTLTGLVASGRLDLLRHTRLQSLLASWPAVLEDVREEELAAKAFVHEQFTPYLGQVVEDLSTVFEWRIEERRTAGSVSDALALARVTLPVEYRLINFIETRQYLAEYILTNYVILEHAAGEIRQELER